MAEVEVRNVEELEEQRGKTVVEDFLGTFFSLNGYLLIFRIPFFQ